MIYKRRVCAKLHRKVGNTFKVMWKRYYSSVTNALKKGVELSLLSGQPGDVLELTESNFEFLIATLKLKLGAKSFMDLKIEISRDLITEAT